MIVHSNIIMKGLVKNAVTSSGSFVPSTNDKKISPQAMESISQRMTRMIKNGRKLRVANKKQRTIIMSLAKVQWKKFLKTTDISENIFFRREINFVSFTRGLVVFFIIGRSKIRH
jgi:hypothetical protein